jgi:hypothetical protein
VQIVPHEGKLALFPSYVPYSARVYRGQRDRIVIAFNARVLAEDNGWLQGLVDFTVDRGLKGIETLAGIPGSVGVADPGGHPTSKCPATSARAAEIALCAEFSSRPSLKGGPGSA